jgi:hypothetical protein
MKPIQTDSTLSKLTRACTRLAVGSGARTLFMRRAQDVSKKGLELRTVLGLAVNLRHPLRRRGA